MSKNKKNAPAPNPKRPQLDNSAHGMEVSNLPQNII